MAVSITVTSNKLSHKIQAALIVTHHRTAAYKLLQYCYYCCIYSL